MKQDPLAKLWRLVTASRRLLADATEVAQELRALAPEIRGILLAALPQLRGTPPTTPWQVLGLTPGATPEQVTKVYRALAAVYHPDVQGTGDAEHFKRLTEAYETLVKDRRGGERDAHENAAHPG